MDIILPYPPAANLSPTGRMKKSAYIERCGKILDGCYPMQGDLYMAARFYPPHFHHADVDNLLKTLLDALKGRAYSDDFQVRALYVVMMDADVENPRVEIRLSEHQTGKPMYGRGFRGGYR